MSQYIVDASVVIQRLIQDTHTQYARALFRGLIQGDELIVPEFCLLECTNVIWKQVRFQGMQQQHGEQLVNNLATLPLTTISVGSFLPRGLQIGLAHQLAVYDSIYLAIAESRNLPVITVDERQSNAAKAIGISIKAITDFT